jgi:hypothetical protein
MALRIIRPYISLHRLSSRHRTSNPKINFDPTKKKKSNQHANTCLCDRIREVELTNPRA